MENRVREIIKEGPLKELVRLYMEVSEAAYRVNVQPRVNGRFYPGHPGFKRPPPALLRKMQLDQAIEIITSPFRDCRADDSPDPFAAEGDAGRVQVELRA